MTMVISPANTMSVTKCRPNTTRKAPTAVPNITAPPSAKGRSCGGASVAGATVQKAWLASPDTKEQFRLQASLGRHQGWKSAVPANCCTPFGRGLPQFSLSTRLAATPGPIRKEPMQIEHDRRGDRHLLVRERRACAAARIRRAQAGGTAPNWRPAAPGSIRRSPREEICARSGSKNDLRHFEVPKREDGEQHRQRPSECDERQQKAA